MLKWKGRNIVPLEIPFIGALTLEKGNLVFKYRFREEDSEFDRESEMTEITNPISIVIGSHRSKNIGEKRYRKSIILLKK